MKIGIYNLEPKYRNLALEKIRKYYSDGGHCVQDCSPIEALNFDLIYCSSLFEWTSKKYILPNMVTGGTGFSLDTVLPPEIDAIEPHINLGYTTRGCPHKCPFCVVNRKEGDFRITGDVEILWDGKAKNVVALDNNVLTSPEHFEHNAYQARTRKITLDYNQGLDFRFLTPEIADILNSYSHPELHFAFDHPSYISGVDKAITLLQSKGIKRCTWYVLVGFDTTFQEDLDRLNYLKSRNQNAYVQRYRGKKKLGKEYISLARWVNQHHIFHGMTWEQFIKLEVSNE